MSIPLHVFLGKRVKEFFRVECWAEEKEDFRMDRQQCHSLGRGHEQEGGWTGSRGAESALSQGQEAGLGSGTNEALPEGITVERWPNATCLYTMWYMVKNSEILSALSFCLYFSILFHFFQLPKVKQANYKKNHILGYRIWCRSKIFHNPIGKCDHH